MQRSRKILLVCHCLLNANAKVRPLAGYPGVLMEALEPYFRQGVGIMQLPCPESSYLGINRWGMSREQYDHPRFRRHCRHILTPCMDQVEAFCASGCEVVGVVGADGSPNCGIYLTPLGLSGGVIGAAATVTEQIGGLQLAKGTGIFMQEVQQMLTARGIATTFMAVDEKNPGKMKTENKEEKER